MTTVSPICNPSAQELPRTGDATGFRCPVHGDFKVADTVFAEDKAKQRAEPDEWPLIIVDDFY